MTTMTLAELRELAARALERAGASVPMAAVTADALVDAEARGLGSHGLARVAQYAAHLRNGRADGTAVPAVVRERGGAVLVDARCGLAFQACAVAVDEAIRRARQFGVSFAGVTNSHHFGVAAWHLAPVAHARMVGLAFGNSPAAMPMAGGRRALFGTNPIAAVRPIPLGWALDANGQPTTDAKAALKGSMLAMGGTKGAMLALTVELLVTALTGAAMGFEASSFFVDEGNRPRIGQAFIVVDPDALAGAAVYFERVDTLVTAMLDDDGVRLPGERREALARNAARAGVDIAPALVEQLRKLAAV